MKFLKRLFGREKPPRVDVCIDPPRDWVKYPLGKNPPPTYDRPAPPPPPPPKLGWYESAPFYSGAKSLSNASRVKTKPLPRCGGGPEHEYWTLVERWPCPRCSRLRDDHEAREAERRKNKELAALIADAVCDELREKQRHSERHA